MPKRFQRNPQKKILHFFEDGKQRYEKFRNERLVEKSKNLSHTITKRNLPKFEEKQKKPKTVKEIARFVTKKLVQHKNKLVLLGREIYR